MTIDLVCVSLEQLIRPQQGERGLQALNLLTSRMSRQAKGHRKSEGRGVSREVSRRVVSRRGGSKGRFEEKLGYPWPQRGYAYYHDSSASEL